MAIAAETQHVLECPVEVPHVLHQRVKLRVDTRRAVLHGVTDIYIRPGRHRFIALHARNLQIDEVQIGGRVVEPVRLQRHEQRSVDESKELSAQDFADYVADDYRAALKAERTQGDLAIPLNAQHAASSPASSPGAAVAALAASPESHSRLPAAPGLHLSAADFQHCSEAFRQHLLQDPLMASAVKVTVRYRKLGADSAVRYLRAAGVMTTDTQLNRARGLVPCVDLPSNLHTWELQVEAGLTDVAVCSGALVSQRLLVGNLEDLDGEEKARSGQQEAAGPAAVESDAAAAAAAAAAGAAAGAGAGAGEGAGAGVGSGSQAAQQGGAAAAPNGEGTTEEGLRGGQPQADVRMDVQGQEQEQREEAQPGGEQLQRQHTGPTSAPAADATEGTTATAAATADGDAMDVDSRAPSELLPGQQHLHLEQQQKQQQEQELQQQQQQQHVEGGAAAAATAAETGPAAPAAAPDVAAAAAAAPAGGGVDRSSEPMDVDVQPATDGHHDSGATTLPPGGATDVPVDVVMADKAAPVAATPAAAAAPAATATPAAVAGGSGPSAVMAAAPAAVAGGSGPSAVVAAAPAAPRTPKRPPPAAPARPPRPYAKVWYYEQPVAVAPCHMHVTVGPLAVVPQYEGSTNQLVESFLKQQAESAGGGGPQDSTTITHFALACHMDLLRATTRFFYLPFKEYQIASTVNFPLSQLQVVFIPSELAVTPVQVAAGCIVASSELLHSDTAVEAALEGKIALAEALAQQWFGIILQPRSSSDVWLVEGLSGLLADHFFRAWLGQNEVAYRRFKERQAVLGGDDGQLPPLCPQNQYDAGDDVAEAGGGGGGGGGAAAAAVGAPRRRRKDPLSQMYGSEALDPSPLRRWKAVAVLRMLERRSGEDSFRSIMQALCRNAANALRSGSPSRPDLTAARMLSTRRFVTECGTAAGMAKDVAAFAERWVYGRGCPRLTAGFTYVRRNNTLLVALKQEGGPEVVAGARSASAQRSKSETAGRGVKVAVYDNDGAVQEVVVERMEAHVDAVVHEIEITSKPGQRGRRKRGGGGAAAAAGGGGDGDGDEDGGGGTQPAAAAVVDENRIPVQYFRVDPGQEWLCDVVVLQTEAMWAAQLKNSKDVVAQSLAVQGLMRLGLQLESSGAADSSSVIGVLLEAVRSPGVYCRVRIEAARALAAFSASMSTQPAAPNLLTFFYDRCRDQAAGVLRPSYWADMGAHLVLQAIPACLANIRDVSFNSPPEALQLIQDILTNNDNSENLYDDSSYLAAVIEAAGLLRPTHASQLSRLLGLLDDYLLRDCLHPSHNFTVGSACLVALTSLALSVNPRQGRGAGAEAKALELYACVRRQLLRFANPLITTTTATTATTTQPPTSHPNPNHGHGTRRPGAYDSVAYGETTNGCTAPPPPYHLLRRAAYQCLLRLEAAEAKVMSSRRGAAAGGLEAKPASRVVVLALRLLEAEPLPALRLAVMMEVLALLGIMQARVLEEAREEGTASQPGALMVPVSRAACAALYRLALGEPDQGPEEGRDGGDGGGAVTGVGGAPGSGVAAAAATAATATAAATACGGGPGEELRVRHLAFMALQVLASQPSSLYRISPDDALAADEVAAEPSNVTGRPPKSHVTGHPLPPGAAAAAHATAGGGAPGPARSVGTAGQPTTTAGTAAAAAQAVPALKRIKMPLVRQGTAVSGAAAPTASAGGVSGPEGSGAATGGGGGLQTQTSEAATGRSPTRSPLCGAQRPSQSQSQRPSPDVTAVRPPDGSGAVPSDGTPTTTKAAPPHTVATPPPRPPFGDVGTAAAPAPSAGGLFGRVGPPVARTPPSGAASPRSPRSPKPPPPPQPAAVGQDTATASPTSGDAGRAGAGGGRRSPPRDPRLSGAGTEPPPPPRGPVRSNGTPNTSPGRQPQAAAAQEQQQRAKPSPRRPSSQTTSPPRPPSAAASPLAGTPSPGPSPRGTASGPTAAAAAAGRGPSPTRPSRIGGGAERPPPGPSAAKATLAAADGTASGGDPPRRAPPPRSRPTSAGGSGGGAAPTVGAAGAQAAAPSGTAAGTAAGAQVGRQSPPTSTSPPRAAGAGTAAGTATAPAASAPAARTRAWPTARAPRPDAAAATAAGKEAAASAKEPTTTAPVKAPPVLKREAPAAKEGREAPPASKGGAAAREVAGKEAAAAREAAPRLGAGVGGKVGRPLPAGPAAAGPGSQAGTAPVTHAGKPTRPVQPRSAAITAAAAAATGEPTAAKSRPQQPSARPPPVPPLPQQQAAAAAPAAAPPALPPVTAPAVAPAAVSRQPTLRIKLKPGGGAAAVGTAGGSSGGVGSVAGGPSAIEANPHLQTVLSRRLSVAGSTGGPPPAVQDAVAASSLPARASASKVPPPPAAVAATAAAAPSPPTVQPLAAGAPGADAAPKLPKVPLKIKMTRRLEGAAPLPAMPAASTASAAPPTRPRPLESDAEFGRSGDVPPAPAPDVAEKGNKAPPRRRPQ